MNAAAKAHHVGKGRPPSLARAEFLLSVGDPDGAVRCARKVLSRAPEQIGALEVLSKALWHLGKYEALLAPLATMIRLNPYEPGYHALRGAALQALGRTGEAIRAFSRCDSQTSAASVEELRTLQEGMIACLLEEDPVFRAHFEQDQAQACSARGFDFQANYRAKGSWFGTWQAQSIHFTRPS